MRTMFRKITACVILILSTCSAYSAEWKIDPMLRFRAGYNDNLNLDTRNEVSTAEATFSPSAVFSVATPTSGASGNVHFDFRRFESDSNLNDNNSRFKLNAFRNLERSRLSLDLGFIKDTTLDSQLEATGLAFGRKRRQSFTVSPNWIYTFNERTRISANYSYRDVNYLNPDNVRFIDFTANSGQASLTRVMNEKTTASLTLSGSQSDSDNNVKSVNINLQGGASYQFNETLSGSLFVGARRTKTDFSRTSQIFIFSGNNPNPIGVILLPSSVTNRSSGVTFSTSLTKSFLRGEIGLSASRDTSNDINGQPIVVTRLSSSNLYRFSDILSANLRLEYYNSQSNDNVGSSLNRNYIQIEPGFNWALKKFWSLSGSYRYRKQTFDSIKDDATQNAAYLTLTYRWPRIAVSR